MARKPRIPKDADPGPFTLGQVVRTTRDFHGVKRGALAEIIRLPNMESRGFAIRMLHFPNPDQRMDMCYWGETFRALNKKERGA
jgi:hypothetical protein